MPPPAPFVLLDDARATGAAPARLYERPAGIVAAFRDDEVAAALARLRAGVAGGLHATGYLAYEAGAALDARAGAAPRTATAPLLWFGLFASCRTLSPEQVAAWLPDPAGACAGEATPRIERSGHAAAFDAALDYIAAGDIYQVNLTFPCDVPIHGDPRALYARLRDTARAGWGGIVFTGERWLLSCSPEMFFTLDADRRITARPMKGTAPPGGDPALLRDDPKQRAENLMIVDLIRNDLSRVARAGSVAVPRLFEVELYPTVQQMTSTVTATLAPGRDALDLLAAAFPCGSITGAPKRRAMEIVRELEPHPRNAYTGAIGSIAPDGTAAFNVAIRTLELAVGEDVATLGLGSGIIADSRGDDEWRECLAKGAFVAAALPSFDLIETMRFDPVEGICELDRHLARMKASADALGFAFDRHDARNELQAATFRLRTKARLRLMLARGGAVAIEAATPPAPPRTPVAVKIVPLPVDPSDVRLRHKTSDRGFYDAARHRAGSFEVVFADAEGFLTEGSFTSLFVERGGRLLTPPLARGLLPGVLRARLIEERRAEEADLRLTDLGAGFLIGNALRGLIAARLA